MTSFIDKNQDFFKDLGGTFKRVAMPAMAAGVGTGALSGYLSSKDVRPEELPGERRKRIIRNAIFGLAAGSAAGAAIPMGMKALNTPMTGGEHVPLAERGIDTAYNHVLRHAIPYSVLGVGGTAAYASHSKAKSDALKSLHGIVSKTPGAADIHGDIGSKDTLSAIMHKPDGAKEMISRYARKLNPSPGNAKTNYLKNMFVGREKVREAGGAWTPLSEMQGMMGKGLKKDELRTGVNSLFAAHLQEEPGLVGKGIGKWLGAKPGWLTRFKSIANIHPQVRNAMKGIESKLPELVAENYSKFIRPSASGTRVLPTVAKLGLLGGGAVLGQQLQNRLVGE